MPEGLFTSPAKPASNFHPYRLGGWSDMRCFFHLLSHHDEIVDNAGIEVHDLESAKVQALLAIEELREELGTEADDWSGWRLEIVCPLGTLLHTMRLTQTIC